MIHSRAIDSLSIASITSLIAGMIMGVGDLFSISWVIGLVVALAGGWLAIWYHPDPEAIAVSWIEEQGFPERGSR